MRNAGCFIAKAALLLSLGAAPVHAQSVIRMLSGHPPGGAVDAMARLYAEKLSEGLGRAVIVETRAGAGGRIAAMALKSAPPDGYTLQTIPASALTLYPHTVKKPVYESLKDFVAVGHVGNYDIGLAVNAGVPANDLRQWLEFVKADNKNVTYATGNAGTDLHLLGAALAQAARVPLVHVAHNGSGPATADLFGGHVLTAILPLAQLLPHNGGKLRILAHSATRRVPAAPDVPTFRELGYPELELSGWYVVIAAAGTPADVVARYNDIIVKASRTASVRERMRTLDLEIRELGPAQVNDLLKTHYESWGPIVKASGFRADSQ
jgi:tripartite-type tricarboxylate transporter receptor subunit TctC